MEPNEKVEGIEETEISTEETSVISDFVDLIHCISDYYKSSNTEEMEGDKWKKDSGLIESAVPSVIDKLVKKTFIVQLKKFTK